MSNVKRKIAQRIAKEIKNGDVVNLGIGTPTYVCNFIPADIEVDIHSENGLVGLDKEADEGYEDKDIINASGKPATIKQTGSFFDSAMSFNIIRGGHLDMTVLGALQVDSKGNIANWMIPNKLVPGMGGAMDLTVGAKRVICAVTHQSKNGSSKIRTECDLPLTAKGEVDLIVTELAVMEVSEKGLILKEIAEETSLEEVIEKTEATLIISNNLKNF
ncbi:MAG: 3-oxoacid CoA-transferase subunit B [Halanaerobiales bacterium]|nr:3-oxoacid CoA-transferase subunit B [Halanaerobiales bacterium]